MTISHCSIPGIDTRLDDVAQDSPMTQLSQPAVASPSENALWSSQFNVSEVGRADCTCQLLGVAQIPVPAFKNFERHLVVVADDSIATCFDREDLRWA